MDKREFKRILDAQLMEMHAAANDLEWGVIDRMRDRVQSHKMEQRNSRERMSGMSAIGTRAMGSDGNRFAARVVH